MSQGNKTLSTVLIAVIGLVGLIIVSCCGGFAFLGYQGQQSVEAKRAKEAPFHAKLKGDWVVYATVDGKKKKARDPDIGLRITGKTLRYVKKGTVPKAFDYDLSNMRKKGVDLTLYKAPPDQQKWDIRFRKKELRVVDTDNTVLAMRRDPKKLAKLIRTQDKAWAAEEKKLKTAKTVTATDYCNIFTKDKERADRIYNARAFEISGTLLQKSFNEDAHAVIILAAGDNCDPGVELHFPKRTGRQASEPLRKGDTLRAKCTGDGSFLDTPELKNCTLVEVNEAAPSKNHRKPTKITANALCNAYSNDSDSADQKYLNRELNVSGTIEEITDGIIIGYQMTLKAKRCTNGVFLNFERKEAATDAKKRKFGTGDTIQAACFWDGTTLGVMHLSDCTVID